MASVTQQVGQKRKLVSEKHKQPSSARKRQKYHDSRAIPVQRRDASVSANGELNITSFIKAREFEISALEKSMQKAKKSLSTRAFQQVPRHMRRRTASHNAKKVPRRLRKRAEREMKEDNTPTVSKRTRTPSRKLRLRLGRVRTLKKLTQNRKTVRQKKKEAKMNAQQPDPEKHVLTSRIPRLKKNTLACPPTATTKYKRRQVNKTWLPTHLWHTKRAHMTRPTEPLWRMAIPLSPTEKSYRPSHRSAGAQGCIAWDVSYMSTIACRGTETALNSMLRAFGFTPLGLSATLQRKWRAGSRFARGWIHERDDDKCLIAPVIVMWFAHQDVKASVAQTVGVAEDKMDVDRDVQVEGVSTEDRNGDRTTETVQSADAEVSPAVTEQLQRPKQASKQKIKLDHHIVIRIHPAAFSQFWQELLKVAKLQKPQVLVEDLRFEIGSIDIQGPASTEALLGVLRPYPVQQDATTSNETFWTSLAGLNNPSILPQNVILPVNTVDPRLNHPPKQIKIPKSAEARDLSELLVSWPPDKTTTYSPLLSHKARWMTSAALPSQKAINRRKTLALPGQAPSVTAKDPPIPVMLLASRTENGTSKNAQGTWTVLFPWSCVDPIWRSLMYYPLSSGGTPRFGGLNQKQQLAFEQQVPWFPGDLPGTEAGKAWERNESEKRFDAWICRPPKHRVAWDTLDLGQGRRGEIGRGWACDWDYLFNGTDRSAEVSSSKVSNEAVPTQQQGLQPLTQRQRKAAQAKASKELETRARRRNTSSPESDADPEQTTTTIHEVNYMQLSPMQSSSLLANPLFAALPSIPALVTVRITLLDKGTPTPAARIYRLPTSVRAKTIQLPSQPIVNSSAKSQDSQPHSWPSDGPPPAQPNPTASTSTSSASLSASAVQTRELRLRWLALDMKSSSQGQHVPKVKSNKSGVSRHQASYPRESLAKINVLPKDAPQEIIDKWGPESAFGRGNGEIPKQTPPPPKGRNKANGTTKGKGKAKTIVANGGEKETNKHAKPTETTTPNAEAVQDLLINPFALTTEWDKHPPCPDPHDLVGFVTSGGYNLAEGRGTAIGGLWAQRLVQGWDEESTIVLDEGNLGPKEKERRKRLCIIRNAGESIGRLGIWEVCS